MKKNMHYYMLGMLCLVSVLVSCEKYEPDLFDESDNGAYFDYEYAADFDKMVNFGEHIVGNPDTVDVMLRVKLLGHLHEEGRTLAVKVKEIEGYSLADVTIEEVAFANNEYEKDVVVRVKRPEVEDSIYGVCVYLDGSGNIGTGISGKDEINLYVTESYEKPVVWYSHVDNMLGAWSKEKHRFLANHTGDDHFYAKLYDEQSALHDFNAIKNLNVSAVNALLAGEPAEPLVVDLPILQESEQPAYLMPYFWEDYEEYLGLFKANKFCRITMMLGSSNTRDIAGLFASDEAMEKMKKEANTFHKMDVYDMLNMYYEYARQGLSIAEYDMSCRVEMKVTVTYDVRIPFWWEDPDNLGTAAIVKKYFGEYEDGKYRFMLQTMMNEDGVADFVAASILPFQYDMQNATFIWDQTPLGKNQLVGEERLKECYRVINEANRKRPASRRFDIPENALDE